MGLEDLPVVVLLQVGAGAVQHPGAAQRQRGRVLAVQALSHQATTSARQWEPRVEWESRALNASGRMMRLRWSTRELCEVCAYLSTGLGAHELDAGVVHEGVEHADGIAATAHARHHLPSHKPTRSGPYINLNAVAGGYPCRSLLCGMTLCEAVTFS